MVKAVGIGSTNSDKKTILPQEEVEDTIFQKVWESLHIGGNFSEKVHEWKKLEGGESRYQMVFKEMFGTDQRPKQHVLWKQALIAHTLQVNTYLTLSKYETIQELAVNFDYSIEFNPDHCPEEKMLNFLQASIRNGQAEVTQICIEKLNCNKKTCTQLAFTAMRAGRWVIASDILSLEIDPIATDQSETLLGLASKAGQLGLLKYLIQKGANPNTFSGDVPPMILAAQGKHWECVEYLLEVGALVNLKDKEGHGVLYYVLMKTTDGTELVQKILAKNYHLDFVDILQIVKNDDVILFEQIHQTGCNRAVVTCKARIYLHSYSNASYCISEYSRILYISAVLNNSPGVFKSILKLMNENLCHNLAYTFSIIHNKMEILELILADDDIPKQFTAKNRLELNGERYFGTWRTDALSVAIWNQNKDMVELLIRHCEPVKKEHLLIKTSPEISKILNQVRESNDSSNCCVIL